MKEATGELNMTVITVIAIVAVSALAYYFVLPIIARSIVNNTCKTLGEGYEASTSNTDSKCVDASTDGTENTILGTKYYCCKSN